MKQAKILLLDIETTPNIVYSWSIGYNLTLTPDQIIEERAIICISYKWLGEKKVYNVSWDNKHSDKKLLKTISKEINKADLIIGHNSNKFDLPWIRTRLLYHGLDPLPNVNQYDTLSAAKRTFRLNSNRLEYIANYLGIKGKNKTSFDLWKQCMAGDKGALREMVEYCNQDIRVLEAIHLKLAPHVKTGHIYRALHKDTCPCCGNMKKTKWGRYLGVTNVYQKYKCNNCSHVWKGEAL